MTFEIKPKKWEILLLIYFFRCVQCSNKNERNRTIQHTQFNDFKNNPRR